MTREQIEKEIDARLDEPDNEWDGIFNSGYSRGFRDGAEWRINSVWHEANKEIPIPFRPILVEHDDGKFSVNMVGGNMKSCPLAWARWAYIDDLLPYGKEDNK